MQKESSDALERVRARYPEQLNGYCRKLLEEHPALRPLYCADPRELDDSGLPPDGLGEIPLSPCPHLIRTYRDRALILTTDACFSRCRFCFRKRLWNSEAKADPLDEKDLECILAFLRAHPETDDILLSGGDPLTLSDEKLFQIIDAVRAVESVRTIRICSRAPAAAPDRITDELAKRLGATDGLWFVCHFDHPDELTVEAENALRRLVRQGVPVLDQTVLLAGVNDDAETLRRLFKRLAFLRVKPHYLFHIDPVEGVSHFATGVQKGLALMEGFRDTLGSIARPDFAVDLPCGGGKVVLTPDDTAPDGSFLSCVTGDYRKHPLA